MRRARFLALYRKQYFTPTIIQRLVKTTPKPRATKKSSGELVACWLGGDDEGVEADSIVWDGVGELVAAGDSWDTEVCRSRRARTTTLEAPMRASLKAGILYD